MTLKKIAALLSIAGITSPAFATNGMNMEGYGPVASGMGGASFAYDNGTAGLINNPATLGLMASGTSRFDIAVGGLHPNVTSKMAGLPAADSDGTAYYMPAMGYVRKDGKLTYGAGLMAQGGMGTEYGSNTFLSGNPGIPSMTGAMTGPTGQANRSELGIGRVMFPLTYDVTDSLQLGGTVDYLWGGLDIQMVMSGQMFGQFAGGTSNQGRATGSMVSTLMGFFGTAVTNVNWAQFDFSKGKNGMTQQLTTTGFAANLGFVWKAAPGLSIGGVYHAKTNLDDMEGTGTLRMQAVTAAPFPAGTQNIPIAGKLKVVDFQWPETYGLGMAYQVNDRVMIAADYKRIAWSKVMKNFHMTFTANATQSDALAQGLVSAGATNMDAVLYQNWEDQNVFMFGGSFKATDAVTVRAGVNIANNPIPDAYMNPLFPAIIKNHYMGGVGYAISKASSVDFSFTYAPKVTATNSNSGVTTTHSQTNWQLMYSQRF
jgi:long-chain fatty acid transport protein